MRDYLHEYNVRVSEARRGHRDAVRRCTDEYELAIEPITRVYESNLDLAARIFRNAVSDAEDAYAAAVAADTSEPPF